MQSFSTVQMCGHSVMEMVVSLSPAIMCHFITPDFKMCFHNLQTHCFPGTHNHKAIAQTLNTVVKEWCISFNKQYTTDRVSNIVKGS